MISSEQSPLTSLNAFLATLLLRLRSAQHHLVSRALSYSLVGIYGHLDLCGTALLDTFLLEQKWQVYQQLNEREGQLAHELSLAQAQLFPLRKDNARLVREANELHREAIAAAETQSASVRTAAKTQSQLTSAVDEANFLRAQVEKKLASQVDACNALQEQVKVGTRRTTKDIGS